MDDCLLFRVFGPLPTLIPFSQQVIDLPDLPPDAKWRFYIDKFALSSSPSKDPEDYSVVVIYGGYRRLAVWKPGDHSWTKLPAAKKFSDVIYFTVKFYGIRSDFQVEAFRVQHFWDDTLHEKCYRMLGGFLGDMLASFQSDLCGKNYLVSLTETLSGEWVILQKFDWLS